MDGGCVTRISAEEEEDVGEELDMRVLSLSFLLFLFSSFSLSLSLLSALFSQEGSQLRKRNQKRFRVLSKP